MSDDGKVAFDGCSYSVEEISRITHLAFKAAQSRRKKVTLVEVSRVRMFKIPSGGTFPGLVQKGLF